jgi:hypothetical protein
MKLFLLFAFSPLLMAQTLQEVNIHQVYVPKGFDTNDQIELSVSGNLPSLCYYSPRVEAKSTEQGIVLTATALYRPGECEQFPVAFFEKVSLPPAPAGQHSIQFQSQGALQTKKLEVVEATSHGIDNFVYAPISEIYEDSDSREIVMSGTLNVDCMAYDRMEMITNDQDAVSLLPVMKKIKEECLAVDEKIVIKYELPYLPQLKRGILIHVRAMNGNSLNMLFQNTVKK